MLEKSVGEKCCRELLGWSVVEKWCREVLWRTVVEKCWRGVLKRSVGHRSTQEMPTNAQLFEYALFCHFCIYIAKSSYLVYNLRLFRTAKKKQQKKWTQTHRGFILAGPCYLNVWTFGFVISILFLTTRPIQCSFSCNLDTKFCLHAAGGISVYSNFSNSGEIKISGSSANGGGAVLRSSSWVFGGVLRWL